MKAKLISMDPIRYELVIAKGKNDVQIILIRKSIFSEKIVHQGILDISQISSLPQKLKEEDQHINSNNIEIIVGLEYPLISTQKVSIPRHVRDQEIEEIITKKTRKVLFNSLGNLEINVAYQKAGESNDTIEYDVSILKTSILSEIIESLGELRTNISAIIPLPTTEANAQTIPNKFLKHVNEDFRQAAEIRYLSKRTSLNHVPKESQNSVQYKRGRYFFSLATVTCLVLSLMALLSGYTANRILASRTERLLDQINLDNAGYRQYSELIQEERSLSEKIKVYNKFNQARSLNAWLIYNIEKVLPETIYLDEINVVRKDSTISGLVIKGVVRQEIDLYRMMETLKSKPHFLNIALNRIIRKNPDFAQFELEMEID